MPSVDGRACRGLSRSRGSAGRTGATVPAMPTIERAPSRRCCWRCGRVAGSGEHLVSNWVAGAVAVPSGHHVGQIYMHTRREGLPAAVKKVQRPNSDRWKVRVVCHECNTGWMSDLDNGVKPLLTPAIGGREVQWDQAAQVEIATWAAMKSLIFDAASHQLSSNKMREELGSASKTARRPSTDMAVFAAAFNEPMTLHAHQIGGAGVGQAGNRLSQWVTTLMLGCLILQVVGRAGSVLPSVLDQAPGGMSDGRRSTIWPPQLGNLSWPPPTIVQRSEVGAFLVDPVAGFDEVDDAFPEARACEQCGVVHDPVAISLPRDGEVT